MNDLYIPPSFNFLAPVPVPNAEELAPERILERLTACARLSLGMMRRGELVWSDVIRAHGEFIINRRLVRAGMSFVVLNGKLAAADRSAARLSIARQMRAVFN